ncbi:hypothetical protein EDS67_21035 [candidate division KSB1 bacterium]|nr:MAG: hypothetical protein EDS67_21035 [candidate division KSB1 bacterium]MBC6948248.1 hypothetical protein [candidate division KSB1 bacterium]MCE7943508.1 hypothetical protein [Chlorobi bacterium CHB1]
MRFSQKVLLEAQRDCVAFQKLNQKRTQSCKGAKNPRSFSLRNLCGSASLRELLFSRARW